MPADNAGRQFGDCCDGLNDVLTNDDFEPLFAVDESGVLYMSVGVIDADDDDDANMVDHPVYFCPFCGTRLQTEAEVEAKTGG